MSNFNFRLNNKFTDNKVKNLFKIVVSLYPPKIIFKHVIHAMCNLVTYYTPLSSQMFSLCITLSSTS